MARACAGAEEPQVDLVSPPAEAFNLRLGG